MAVASNATLASRLGEISKATGKIQARLVADFSLDITGHKHEKLLRECLIQAQMKRRLVLQPGKRNLPKELEDEGFSMYKIEANSYIKF